MGIVIEVAVTIEMYAYNRDLQLRSKVPLQSIRSGADNFGIIIATYKGHMDKGSTINITHT